MQVKSGTACIATRTLAALAAYHFTNGNMPATIAATQAASGISYVASYAMWFFPNANKENFQTYWGAVRGSSQYLAVEQLVNLSTMIVTGASQLGYTSALERTIAPDVAVPVAASFSS